MDANNKLVDHLFRHQYGKMVAILTRLFGFKQLHIAEDLVQESFIKALTAWKMKGLPDNPEAWLMQTAKHLAIDHLRKEKVRDKHVQNLAEEAAIFENGAKSISINNLFLAHEVEDAQLRMIFACCHPSLKYEDQLALTLQIVSGFGLAEIAASLLVNKELVKKRLQRAKKKLQTAEIALKIPTGEDLTKRLPVVEKVIYLIFNEGYSSIKSTQLIRRELCLEALRLGRIITEHKLLASTSTLALMGLMCFHSARLESRINAADDIILLEDQDRKKWNQTLIGVGNIYMMKAVASGAFSSYHYQAAIAAEYMKSESFQTTNWSKILGWYQELERIEPSPFYKLNQSIVHLYAGNISAAENILASLAPDSLAQRQYLWHSVQAQIFRQLGREKAAIDEWLIALKLAPTQQEKKLIEKKIAQH